MAERTIDPAAKRDPRPDTARHELTVGAAAPCWSCSPSSPRSPPACARRRHCTQARPRDLDAQRDERRLAVALLTAGVLADDRGHRRVFVAGLVVLGVASAVAAAAGHAGIVIAARLVEGLGGAAVLAGGLGMIAHAYPAGPARARAGAIWGASVGAGTGLGGIVAVVLDGADGSWRVTYAATAVAALVLAVAGSAVAARVGGGPAPSGRRGRGAAARRGHGRAARRAGREPLGCAVAVAGPARRRGRAARCLRGGAGPPAGTADRSRSVPVARVRRRHRGRAGRRDRRGRRRVLHADGAAARSRGVAGRR